MKIKTVAMLLIGALLLGALGAVSAQEDLENSYTSQNGALTIDYPEEWFAFEEDGFVFLVTAEDLLEEDVLPPGSAMLSLLLPDLLSMLDVDEEMSVNDLADMMIEFFAEEDTTFGEVEEDSLGEDEHALVTVPMVVADIGEGILGAVELQDGMLGVWAMTAEGEWDDFEPTIMAMLESASYVEPVLELPTDNAVEWVTETVSLTASNFYITAGGKVFTADVDEVDVSSDPGDEEYTTLELEWIEHDVVMRLNIYFEADGETWQAFEMRTYNGADEGDWVYYEDGYFTTPLGEAYADEEFVVEMGSYSLSFKDLELQAFTGD
jgi:hypothetical protein